MPPAPENANTLEQMLADARVELKLARRSVVKWEAVVSALEFANSTDSTRFTQPPKSSNSYPIPRDAILAVMKDNPSTPMRLKEIVGLLKEGGLYDPDLKAGDNAYGTALRRLSRSSKYQVFSEGSGEYVYDAEREKELQSAGLPHNFRVVDSALPTDAER